MGQYFLLVNKTQREYVSPWDVGGVAKLWEWCVNPWAGLFPYLLRKSDGNGGGDIDDEENSGFAGRWAGDEVYLIGDYDSSNLFDEAIESYENISLPLAKEYNAFVQIESATLEYKGHEKYAGSYPAKDGRKYYIADNIDRVGEIRDQQQEQIKRRKIAPDMTIGLPNPTYE